MILDLVYTSRNLYISNRVKFRPTYLLLDLGVISLSTKSFYHLVNTRTFTEFAIKIMALRKLMSVQEKISSYV